VKGLRMPKKQYLILSLTLFLIYSCANDDSQGPSPATIIGTWSSGELSYHQTNDCLNQGQSLEDFTNATIATNVESQAQIVAEALCDENDTECIASELDEWTNTIGASLTAADSLLFTNLISNTFSFNNMTLIINSGSSYEAQYDGSCNIENSYEQAECEALVAAGFTEWSEVTEECNIIDETYCGIAGGEWDSGWVGDWEEDGDNYTLHNFNDEGETTKTLVFDGSDLFIVLSNTENQCLCSSSTPSDSSTECVDVDDCVWLEGHCISLNFSK